MTVINEFNNGNIGNIMDDCRDALELVAEEYGLVLQRKTCRYSSDDAPVSFRLLVPERTEDGEAVNPKETEFRKYARRFGLEPDDYGKLFKTYNGVYRVSGIKPRGKKFNVLGEHVNTGKTYKFPSSAVVDGLERHSNG